MDNATSKLLVATPRTGGEVFRRSVVLVLHHDEEGAQGVVLNRPWPLPSRPVLPPWQDYVTDPPTVFQGGPVALDSALGLVTVPGDHQEPMGVRLLFGGIGLVDLDIPPLVVVPEVAGLRIFAGYAGWSGGQLSGRFATEAGMSWSPRPATPSRRSRKRCGPPCCVDNVAISHSSPASPKTPR